MTGRGGATIVPRLGLICSLAGLVLLVGLLAGSPRVMADGVALGDAIFENAVEDAVDSRLDSLVAGASSERFEGQVEEQVEEQVETAVEESVNSRVDSLVAGVSSDRFEEQVEEQVEEAVEEAVEQSTGDIVEEQVEDAIAETLEDAVEQSIEEEVEASVVVAVAGILEQYLAEKVEASLEDDVEDAVEESVAEAVQDTIEESIEESVAETVTDSVEESIEETVEEAVAIAVDASVEDSIQSAIEDEVAAQVEEGIVDATEGRLETHIDRIIDDLESGLDIDENRIQKEQWLVMAEPEVFQELAEKGYIFDEVTDLPGLGMRLAEVAAPSSFDITDVRRGVLDVVGKERAEVDLNHIYMAGTHVAAPQSGQGMLPRAAMAFPEDIDSLSLRIGMIDSEVDVSHPALDPARIKTRSFVSRGAQLPDFHGTAIASIIAGDSADYRGLAPDAEVYAAAVFEKDAERGEIASTVSLLRALDWLITSNVEAVNISLAGPPNRLLEAALNRAAEQNVLILAAAGNGGPAAQPMYPAAYGTVIAVTAVDASRKVFRLANRGEYLDLAAPGVGLRHARAGGGYSVSSGTSFAVPFAATAAARLRHLQPEGDTLSQLFQATEDLGPPGRDAIYGRGILTPEG